MKQSIISIIALLATIAVGSCSSDSDKKSEPARRDCWKNEKPGATCREETTDMEFVFIPGGDFWMGCSEQDTECEDGEKPRHQVHLNSFWMGKYEVTQAQWEKIMGHNPTRKFKGTNYPVGSVSWDDTQEFVKLLNAKSGKDFRLPSEAEWEYAARAGAQTIYSFGDDPKLLGEYAWYKDNSDNKPHPVGQKQPNAFGLFDMHGNMEEWVADSYLDYTVAPADGRVYSGGPGSRYVIRGCTWKCAPAGVRSSNRIRYKYNVGGEHIGVRLAKTK